MRENRRQQRKGLFKMDERLDFLFLTEEEAVQAGAKDMPRCIEVMDEMFSLLGQGDYLMGTPNQNAHGIKIYFPKETPFPNMPVKGPVQTPDKLQMDSNHHLTLIRRTRPPQNSGTSGSHEQFPYTDQRSPAFSPASYSSHPKPDRCSATMKKAIARK